MLRSPHAHAEIVSLDAAAALSMPEVVTVLTGAEVAAWSRAFIAGVKQPMRHYALAVDRVRYTGEPVAVVAARDRYAAEDALERIEVEYRELDPVVDPVAAAAPGAPLLHRDVGSNVVSDRRLRYGDPDAAFASAATSATNRVTTLEAAVTGDGTITALHWDQLDDCGAYLRAPEPASLYRTHGHMTGPYRIAHLEIHNRVVLTNKTPTGLNRGFGGPQVYFALERLVHRIAKTLGLDPLDVIRRNLVPGTVFRVFQQCQSISAVNAGLTMPTRWSDTSASTRRPASCVSASPTTTPRRRWTRRGYADIGITAPSGTCVWPRSSKKCRDASEPEGTPKPIAESQVTSSPWRIRVTTHLSPFKSLSSAKPLKCWVSSYCARQSLVRGEAM